MTDRATSSDLPVNANSNSDTSSESASDSTNDSHEQDLQATVPAIDRDENRIYFMNLSGQNSGDGVFLTKVTIEDKDDLTGKDREVRNEPLSSPVELAYRALHLLPVLDIDKDGIVSRTEFEGAAKDPQYKGTDVQVIAGLSDPSAWERLINFSNDERGKETGISSEDVWTIAERRNDVAVQAAYAAAIANFQISDGTAGH